MENISELLDKAIKLGFEGDAARVFVQEQIKIIQDIEAKNNERELRLVDREDRKLMEAREEKEKERAEREKERLEKEKERKFKLDLAQREIEEREEERKHEIELAKIKSTAVGGSGFADDSKLVKSLPKIPPFNEDVDEIDTYIQRFEKLAVFYKWETEDYPILLGTLLRGKALKAYCNLAPEVANNYDELKSALLKYFQVNPNAYRKKFRDSVLESGESYVQLVCRMRQYFDRWLQLSEVSEDFESVCDFMVIDQLLSNCSKELREFLLEKFYTSSHEMAESADRYMIAHGVSKCKKSKARITTDKSKLLDSKIVGDFKNIKCHLCGQIGHIKPNCPDNPRNFLHSKSKVQSDGNSQQTRSKSQSDVPKISVAFAREEAPLNCIIDDNGKVFGSVARTIFDTGCNTVVIKESLIPKSYKLGKVIKVYNFLGIPIYLPRIKCNIKSRFFSGKVNAVVAPIKCADVLIGLIPGLTDSVRKALDMLNGDDSKDITINVVTRSQSKQNQSTLPLINNVPDVSINPNDFAEAQQSCLSLEKIRKSLETEEEVICRGRVVRYMKYNGLIYRECIRSKDVRDVGRKQLLVPLKYRDSIMKLGHESLLSGHFSSRKTTDRILHKFFWPNAGADITRFCRSCHSCQKFGPRAKKVPMSKMPIISEPFSRIAIDIVGPITPATNRGHKYILTVIDLATRYPEAVALRNIDTITIAESLVEVFCRVGVPREILSDRGSQFKSDLMSEIHRLLSIKALYTSPYHAACNGTVERLNGVLKNMLKKVCMDNPADWDRYIPVVLFAYREIPNDSLKFSPFELLYGRTVRGPLTILHELITNDEVEDNVKTTYQYVIDLRSKLQDMSKLAVANAEVSSSRYKEYFDRKAKYRKLKQGDEILVMLPTNSNKFLMQWKGPYIIDGCHNNGVDYFVKVGNNVKLYHANMIKRYYRRNVINIVEQANGEQIVERVHEDCFKSNEVFPGVTNNVSIISDSGLSSDVGKIEFCEVQTSTLNMNPNLTEVQASCLNNLVGTFTDVICEKPGVTNVLEHHINVTSDVPFQSKNYPIPVNLLDTFNTEVDKMIALDIIEPSTSPYCSPVVLVKKADNSWRLCIDFRKLNSITIFDAEPMPSMSECLHEFSGKRFFTELDLCKGYWQVPMAPSSKMFTAFATKYGLMQFRKMPFGLKTACATFVRLMRKVLSGLSNTSCYFDNIVIHSSSFEDHLNHITDVLVRLRESGLTAGSSKCFFAFHEIKYLGLSLGNNVLHPLEDRVKDIAKMPLPKTKKQLRSFMGTVNFYNRFIPDFSTISAPITNLLRKGNKNVLEWSQEQIDCFERLKKCLTSNPILMLPDINKTFFLRTDASGDGMGAVLLQETEGILKPVSYGSKKFSDAEKRYSCIERECYAIVWAIQKFREYLLGREFVLQTDHLPLSYLNDMKNKNDRLMRWALSLQPFAFHVQYIKGSDNIGADMLSRCC